MDKLIIIRSIDDISWERFSEFGTDFFDSRRGERDYKEIFRIIHGCADYEDYYWETVSSEYFEKFKKPFV